MKAKRIDVYTFVINGAIKAKRFIAYVTPDNIEFSEFYHQLNDDCIKDLFKEMASFYNGHLEFGGFFGEDNIAYIYSIEENENDGSFRILSEDEINELYYSIGSPENINIEFCLDN